MKQHKAYSSRGSAVGMSAADIKSDPAISPLPMLFLITFNSSLMNYLHFRNYLKLLIAMHNVLTGHTDEIRAIFRFQTFDLIFTSDSWLKHSVSGVEESLNKFVHHKKVRLKKELVVVVLRYTPDKI
ncbi:hypothetical protein J6590_099909 [Homalodisca vitripennis]|nr:hypothetical protein J6590_099909 [Homalodisca vitripennis]